MNQKKNILNGKVFWITLLGLVILKYGYYGFKYYPVIDDWIQYGGYSLYDHIFRDVILRIGTYTTRPIASLSDPYLWGQLWDNMWVAFLIITLLHFISAWLLYKVFEYNRLPIGMVFLAIFLLLPLGTEATYWISASSRIVVGIFFMALSLYFLSIYMHSNSGVWGARSGELRNKKLLLTGFALTHLISFGYYEQVIILSFASTVLLIAANWMSLKRKWIAVIPFINLGIIGAYYKMFGGTGNVAQRGNMIDGNFSEHFSRVMDKISDVWGRSHLPLYPNGFNRGISLLFNNHSYFYLFLIILLSISAGVLASQEKSYKDIKLNGIKIFLGFALFCAPFAIYFLLNDIWISNRNAFTSFIGLGLLAEGITHIVNRNKITNMIKGIVICYAVFIFMIVNISELTDYKNVSQIDRQISSNVVSAIDDNEFFEGRKKVVVFGTLPKYIEQNSYFHEHIHNVTESDWAFTGGIRAVARNAKIQYVRPVHKWSAATLDDTMWGSDIILGIDNERNVFHLKHREGNNGDILLSKMNGEYFGELQKQDDERYVLEVP
ncbi:MAG: glucosyltransferase domain-containing protein [Clostridia bacterium]